MRAFSLALLLTLPAIAQVRVEVRMSQPEYLAGEPIFAVVQVTNQGSKPVGYSLCLGAVELSVRGERQSLCEKAAAAEDCGVPPKIETGESVEFWYLLRGYRLAAGDYELRAAGHAGVAAAAPFETELHFTVRPSTPEQLAARYVEWIAAVRDERSERHSLAREVIRELIRECPVNPGTHSKTATVPDGSPGQTPPEPFQSPW